MGGRVTRFRIVDTAGNPVVDGILSVVGSSVPFPEIALLADERGMVEVQLPTGRFTVRAQADSGRVGDVTVVSPASGESVVEIEVR